MSWALAGFAMLGGGPGTGPLTAFLAAAFFGAVGLAVIFSAAAVFAAGAAGAELATGAAAISSRSLRATGASTVLDADLTNSPIFFSLASTVLLSTPNSFASSCTRALPATALLTPRSPGQVTRSDLTRTLEA